MSWVWCPKQHIKVETTSCAASGAAPRHVPQNQFFANISRSMSPRGKSVGIQNIPREISYWIGYSRIIPDLSISLKIHSSEYKLKFLPYVRFLVTFCIHYEPKIFHQGLIDREIYEKKLPKT